MSGPRSRVALGATSIALAAWLAACTGTLPARQPGEVPPGHEGVPTAGSQLSQQEIATLKKQFLTYDHADPQGDLSIELAIQERMRQCMVAKGYAYDYDANRITNAYLHPGGDGRPTGSVVPSPIPVNAKSGYGLYASFVAMAQDKGTPNPEESGRDPNTVGMSKAEASAYENALEGVHPTSAPLPSDLGGPAGSFQWGGCTGEALVAAWGDPMKSLGTYQISTNAGLEVRQQTEEDEGYVKALLAWRRCMSSAGYDATSPILSAKLYEDAVEKAYMKAGPTEQNRQKELALARTDIGCRKSSDLQAAWDTAEKSAETAFVLKWEVQMLQVEQDHKDALARAKQILAGSTVAP